MTPNGVGDIPAAGRGALAGGRVHPARRLAAVVLVVGVLGGLLLAPPDPVAAASTGAVAGVAGVVSAGGSTSRGAPGCRDVLFLGARGSGQKGVGVNTDKSKKDYDAGSGLGREVFAAWTQAKDIKRRSNVAYTMD
jgi:hypothetical protein